MKNWSVRRKSPKIQSDPDEGAVANDCLPFMSKLACQCRAFTKLLAGHVASVRRDITGTDGRFLSKYLLALAPWTHESNMRSHLNFNLEHTS
jgi:hypothetical protein